MANSESFRHQSKWNLYSVKYISIYTERRVSEIDSGNRPQAIDFGLRPELVAFVEKIITRTNPLDLVIMARTAFLELTLANLPSSNTRRVFIDAFGESRELYRANVITPACKL